MNRAATVSLDNGLIIITAYQFNGLFGVRESLNSIEFAFMMAITAAHSFDRCSLHLLALSAASLRIRAVAVRLYAPRQSRPQIIHKIWLIMHRKTDCFSSLISLFICIADCDCQLSVMCSVICFGYTESNFIHTENYPTLLFDAHYNY